MTSVPVRGCCAGWFSRLLAALGVFVALCAARTAPAAELDRSAARFVAGFNLNGPAVTIEGRRWQAGDAPHLEVKARAFENQEVPLIPQVEAEMSRMLRSSRWGDVDIALTSLQPGKYSLLIYVWEDNNPERFDLAINGKAVVRGYRTGPAGRWERLGPFTVSAAAERIRITTKGGAANLSGIELWQGELPSSGMPPPLPTAEQLDFFEQRIRPLLIAKCYDCHSQQAGVTEGELWVDSRIGLARGGSRGPALVPGDAQHSLLLKAVRYEDEQLQMPPDGQLAAHELADLEAWIRAGAADPRSEDGAAIQRQVELEEARQFWSLRPVQRPAVPPVEDKEWPLNEIDHFILARLEQAQLKPVDVADRRTLIRRASYDLLGLPPDPAEVLEFVNDPSPLPEAFSRLVERLLASPHYAERWGRHWMDLVRYADTAGDNSDYPIPQAYLYRNYIIDSLNADKPYDQFLREQLAGDLLPAESDEQRNEQLIATGYIAMARRFGSLIENYPQHLTIEDTLDNLGRTFLGMTISCARCHDHKFDPISQQDYYGLYGLFDSTRYPFPGIELDKKPRDFVPLAKTEQSSEALAYAVIDHDPHDARLHRRGEPKDEGDVVPRKFLDVLGGQRLPDDARGSSGRLQLAQWITDDSNPLTARVMVNRIWQHHFGTGLVSTPSDFGTRGQPPTHPELLDWLAARFVEEGWSLKQMHRLMMQSRTYLLAGGDDEGNMASDPANTLHWRFNRRRLDAEQLRDTLLAVGGTLDESMPRERHPFPPAEEWKYTQHHPFKDDYPSRRRSVYLMTRRLRAQPYFMAFDGADANATTPRRDSSVTATQALYLMNNEFVHEQAAALAERVLGEQEADAQRLARMFELVLCRPPSEEETSAALAHVASVTALLKKANVPAAERPAQAWSSYARVLLQTSEFLYID